MVSVRASTWNSTPLEAEEEAPLLALAALLPPLLLDDAAAIDEPPLPCPTDELA
jgi:hypothetical protein